MSEPFETDASEAIRLYVAWSLRRKLHALEDACFLRPSDNGTWTGLDEAERRYNTRIYSSSSAPAPAVLDVSPPPERQCPVCKGRGEEWQGGRRVRCHHCHGRGRVAAKVIAT